MRKSTKLIGAAVAVGFIAVAGGSAFTASNTVPNTVAGYGESTVSGATVTSIHYNTNPADTDKIDSVTFVSSTDLTNTNVSMSLKGAGGLLGTSPYSCTYTAFAAGASTITCLTADEPSLTALTATDLTVA
jgi:hypothetical protein